MPSGGSEFEDELAVFFSRCEFDAASDVDAIGTNDSDCGGEVCWLEAAGEDERQAVERFAFCGDAWPIGALAGAAKFGAGVRVDEDGIWGAAGGTAGVEIWAKRREAIGAAAECANDELVGGQLRKDGGWFIAVELDAVEADFSCDALDVGGTVVHEDADLQHSVGQRFGRRASGR